MTFGIKGPGFDRSRHHNLFVLCLLATLLCFFGYLASYGAVYTNAGTGMSPAEGQTARVLFAIGVYAASAAGIRLAIHYADSQTRWGAIILISLPLVFVLCLALGLVGVRPV